MNAIERWHEVGCTRELLPIRIFGQCPCGRSLAVCGHVGDWPVVFDVRDMQVKVVYRAPAIGGRIASAAEVLYERLGIELMYAKNRSGEFRELIRMYVVVNDEYRFVSRDAMQKVNKDLDAISPAYASSYTRYVERDKILCVLIKHASACDYCGEWTATLPRRTNLDEWITHYVDDGDEDRVAVWCSEKCRRDQLAQWIRERRHERRQREWVKKGKKDLAEIRRLLKGKLHQEASKSPPRASKRGTTSPT